MAAPPGRKRPPRPPIITDFATPVPVPNPVVELVDAMGSFDHSQLTFVRLLGRGGFGEVKLYRSPSGELVAVKAVPLYADTDKEREHMLCEVRTLNSSDSDYLVRLRGAFFHDDKLHLAMEFMDGGSLRDVLKSSSARQRMPEAILGKIAVAVMHGMNYLKKEKGVMHRDIKPDNILVASDGSIKLADLGIAKKLEDSIAKTNVGTTYYLAPERIRGDVAEYNITADVWAFGVTMIELATGAFPYEVASEFLVLDAIVNSPAPGLLPADGWSEEICHFLAACLEKNPDMRPRPWELLSHPFILKWQAAEVAVSTWLDDTRPATSS
ncbi:STE/STE7 protein kinase [Thecamonas trahens ATCC 50062]|uniref:mitogen-activated protein kinase kinase n=1 Tax=Thecamonas trahens ATCC 50062 TaxID=461836 RepID=A0A0L0D2P1_THETB|nr:STE/STE7 protein kinase [Thecamonas trahens ATCC 50062]KNC46455.1 STE/STE7 protein kinase [Thecamonas trahens ATCC 50062]|eukprot:XP_013760746.1 STE/STE7 protein kinase [Thecamonas trahens ATCC 50062]